MNIFNISIVLSFSVFLPVCAVIYRWNHIEKVFRPFTWLLWLGLLNDTLSLVFAYTLKTTAINTNIYVLLEYLLVLYQFGRWNNAAIKACISFAALGVIVWSADNLLIHPLDNRNGAFRIFYSFIIIFFSINEVNKLIVYERRSLLKNPVFLICFTFLAYYSYKAFVEVFMAFGLNLGNSFSQHVCMVLLITNFISNILYTIAVLCIPPKLEFTLPY